MKLTKIFVIVLFAVLVGCTRTVVQVPQQQSDPNGQVAAQPMPNQPDPTDPNNDQYWAQQSYYQWQQQNPNQSFDYFLLNVWALQTQRAYYYQNVFGYNTYSPPMRSYRYSYRKTYTPMVINRTNNNRTIIRAPAPSPRWANSPAPNSGSLNQKSPSKYSSGNSSFFPKKSAGTCGGSYGKSSTIWKKRK